MKKKTVKIYATKNVSKVKIIQKSSLFFMKIWKKKRRKNF